MKIRFIAILVMVAAVLGGVFALFAASLFSDFAAGEISFIAAAIIILGFALMFLVDFSVVLGWLHSLRNSDKRFD